MRDTEKVEEGIKTQDPPKIVSGAANIARRADRVLQMAEMEVQNSDDPTFVSHVSQASVILSAGKISGIVSVKKQVLSHQNRNCRYMTVQKRNKTM